MDPVADSDDFVIMPETELDDFQYTFNRIPLALSFTYFAKRIGLTYGVSAGYNSGLFAQFIVGSNFHSFEIGGYLDLAVLDNGSASFDYYSCESYSRADGCSKTSELHRLEVESVFYERVGVGFYTTFIFDDFSVSYSPYLYLPIIPDSFSSEYLYELVELRVVNPPILSQYLGVNKWIGSHWKIMFGITGLSDLSFHDVGVGVSGSAGFWV